MAGATAVFLLILWAGEIVLFRLRSGRGSNGIHLREAIGQAFKSAFLTGPFLRTMERLRLWDRMPEILTAVHRQLAVLSGTNHSIDATKRFIAESIGMGYFSLTVGAVLAAAGDEPIILILGCLTALVIPLGRTRDVRRKLERRKQDMLLALPELLGKLILLVGAGDTLLQAITRCLERNRQEGGETNPLFAELTKMCNEVRNGVSFPSALEAFSKRCAVQEVALFTTTLLLNYRRGGDRFTASLRGLSGELWEKRKALARSRGEEASSKLVFPLVAIFLVLMVLVASPAMMLLA